MCNVVDAVCLDLDSGCVKIIKCQSSALPTREGEAPGVIAAVAVARFRRRAEASLLNQGV